MIGPKCIHCKKQRKYHDDLTLYCPVGKRHKLFGYQRFNPMQTFEAKEPKSRGSAEKRKDRKTRRAIKAEPCLACRQQPGDDYNPVDVCHIRPFSVSQNDADWNCLPQCRHHHRIQHVRGWLHMAQNYPGIAQALKEKGWEFIVNESTGDWSMFNPAEVELNRKRRAI